MLSFSSTNLFIHREPTVFATDTYTVPPPEVYIDNGEGEVIRNTEIPPVIGSVYIGNIDFNSARVDWDVFVPPNSNTLTEIKVYEYAENNPYSSELLRYSANLNSLADIRIHQVVTNLDETTDYRVRIRGVAVIGTQTLTSEWYETQFTTNAIPSDLNGAYRGFYYINGIKTTLDASGEGFWDNVYYINGVQTNLEYIDCLGVWVGYLWGRFYVNFEEAAGIFDCSCCTELQKQLYDGNYSYGLRTPQGWSGTGFIPSYLPTSPWMTATYGYLGGAGSYGTIPTYRVANIPFSGYANGKFYVDGVESPFDLNGVGSIQVGGTTYNFLNGAPISGYRNGVYYIGGVATSLSADGTGTWNNSIYNKGGFVSLVNTPYSWQSGAIDEYNYYGSSFGSGITYG